MYKYSVIDVNNPNLYRRTFPANTIPKYQFISQHIPVNLPKQIWITDTSFRDGQQSRAPYTVEQIVKLYTLLHKLGGPKGLIRQTEFFLYSDRDKEAVYQCLQKGFKYPEITGWIRAAESDFQLVKNINIKEVGILTSCSDFHIFKKLKMTRKQVLDKYLGIVKNAIEEKIKPRCHFEDITRADFFGFVIPFAQELKKIMLESGIPIKIRLCDTLGVGVFYADADLPRSIPAIIHGLQKYADYPSELLEWHGHEDFYKSVANAVTAWRYGASSVNCTLLGIGERTGNIPLEAMVFEYAQLKGTTDGMDTTVITEIAEYYEKTIGYKIPARTPFVGESCTMTQTGIHADGILKDKEIYSIFNTRKFLKRPTKVAINQASGHAGITYWINMYYGLKGTKKIDKQDIRINQIKLWIDDQYKNGRTTTLEDNELDRIVKKMVPDIV